MQSFDRAQDLRVALVYDRVNKWGGAERVLLALHKLFPQAPLYTSVYDKKKAPWASVFDVKTSFLQRLPSTTNHELFAAFMPIAFESFSFDKYDLVISVTSEAAKGIITKPKTRHVCYCLTPTRYLWSGYDEYFKNPYLRFFSKPFVSYLKNWDKIASHRPDYYIAISKEVQGRIKKYYGRDSKIVYPPLMLGRGPTMTFPPTSAPASILRNDAVRAVGNPSSHVTPPYNHYFLIVSRLVSYKKIDLAVHAFNKLKLPLKIIGIGSEMGRLKRMAGPTIEFLGNLTDKELVRYYSECRALVFPGMEDFGLTMLEAQSFGKPVIAFRGGGALETIIDGKTGIFFDEQSIKSLSAGVERFNNTTIDSSVCKDQAQKFSFEQFKKKFMKTIEKI
ncbi:MAG: glycosyltransferase [Candidatus Levybacteria bacterium]|nr:glycosyltransferase [Candidatus Levybacteria bacterium]